MTFLYEILGKPFGIVLKIIYDILGTVDLASFALSIILLTLFARVLMIPSSIKQQKGMAKTQRMQAKIRKIQEKYAGDQKRIQEETQALYQREGYNPLNSGCSSMIWQFVILFGLIGAIYYPLTNTFGISEADVTTLCNFLKINPEKTFTYQILVLSKIDQLQAAFESGALTGIAKETLDTISNINFEFFGLHLGEIPNEHKKPDVVWLIPILSFLSSMLTGVYSMIKQKRENPTAGNNPMMGCMMLFAPILSLIFVIRYPIGIGVYWIASSLFGFISSLLIGHFYSPKKTLAKLMIDETVERRSKEENIKLIAARNNKED